MSRFAFGVRSLSIAALLCCTVVACRGINGTAIPPVVPLGGAKSSQISLQPLATNKIQHVVIIIQENRSFNNLFYGYPRARTKTYGFAGKEKIRLHPTSLATTWDPQHNGQGFIISCNGTGKIQGTNCQMNGFDKERCSLIGCPKSKDFAYAYVPHQESKPYFDMADQYVLADEMYASDFDISSFESHQYIIAGVNPKNSVDYPNTGNTDWGCIGGLPDQIAILFKDRKWLDKGTAIKSEEPCWNVKTLGDELDNAKLPWAYYAVAVDGGGKYACGEDEMDPNGKRASGLWSAYQAIKHICYGRDWTHDVAPFSPPSNFLRDIKNGNLRAVTWITPTNADSDHGGSDSTSGPSWVASLVNAIGESKFWDSTAIFIFWDDSGGWYDPEPPHAINYDNYDSLGYRLPLLIISPYAKKGYVDHTPYEHGSILKFVEDVFRLPRLEPESERLASDRRANRPDDPFDFSKPPRKFVKIKAPLNADYFLHERLDGQPPDTD